MQLAGRVFEHFAKKCVIGHNIKGGRCVHSDAKTRFAYMPLRAHQRVMLHTACTFKALLHLCGLTRSNCGLARGAAGEYSVGHCRTALHSDRSPVGSARRWPAAALPICRALSVRGSASMSPTASASSLASATATRTCVRTYTRTGSWSATVLATHVEYCEYCHAVGQRRRMR